MDFFAHHLGRVRSALDALASRESFDVLFFSLRPEYFDASDIETLSTGVVRSVTFCGAEADLWNMNRKFDVAIACTHVMNDHLSQMTMRAMDIAPLLVAWTWDNHHLPFHNLCVNSLADIVLPAHQFCSDMLKAPHYLLGKSFPLCTAQWSRELAETLLKQNTEQRRSDALYGGYVLWEGGGRTEQLLALQREIPGNKLSLMNENDRRAYFDLSPEMRFRDWASHKVSIQIPYAGDLSLRVFDALLAGQIPIVPGTCRDLDAVVPRSIQDALPILRIDDVSVPTVMQAWQEGLKCFDTMGRDGVLLRHAFARDHHHITSRVKQIVSYLADLRKGFDVDVRINNTGIGLVHNW